ncbi:MAG: DUF423 domain-containing protein, partial [Bdellovibrionia bacterium]
FATYQTAVQYQLIHALALIAVGIWAAQMPGLPLRWVIWAFSLGILIFSGSLVVVSVAELRFFGVLTPLGGVCFLIGWMILAIVAARS